MKDKLLLIRYGAYGDCIFMSSVLPYLFDRYEVHFETNLKGASLFRGDPRFASISLYEPFKIPEEKRMETVLKHWEDYKEQYKGWRILNFFQALEGTGIVHENHPDARLPQYERKKKFEINFYDQHFKMAEIEMPKDFVPPHSIYFQPEETAVLDKWRKKNDGYFVMMVAMAGSTMQKVFPTWLETFCKSLIDELPKLKIYLLGDSDCLNEDWEYERTVGVVPRKGRKMPMFKQVLGMTKYANYVFGPETGLLVGAGMWGTPKTALMTGASLEQFAKYTLNDHSEQSNAPCSPCYRTCYTGKFCQKEMFYDSFPRCTVAWDFEKLKENIRGEYHRQGY